MTEEQKLFKNQQKEEKMEEEFKIKERLRK